MRTKYLALRKLNPGWYGSRAIKALIVHLAFPLCLLAQNAESPKFALLVGVDKYANLSPAEQLDGSANDIELIRSVLINRFDFPADKIIQRSNEQATGDGIRAAFAELLQQIDQLPDDSPTAQVYFHFSGHGSQVADQAEGHEDRDEPDGFDETLVPHDAERQGGRQDIRDDEINKLINQVVGDATNPRARIILVYDCCHSGSGARGATKIRQLSRPIDPVDPATTLDVRRKRLPPGVVFLSACHETEVEPEFEEDGKTYGLLTRFLSQVLTEHETLSELSYDSLRDAIRSRYQSHRRVVQAPHPQLEASDLETRRLPFLGATRAVDRPANFPMSGKTSSGAYVLNAGRLHGFSPGALLEVFENSEAAVARRPIGTLKLKSVNEFESEGEFVRFDDAKQNYVSTLPPNTSLATAVVSLLADPAPTGQTRIKILGADGPGDEPETLDVESLPLGLGTELKQLLESGKISIVEESPDLVLKVRGETSSLFPASGIAHVKSSAGSTAPDFLRGGWGPFDAQGTDAEGSSIGDYVDRIVKAKRLVRLAEVNKDKVHSDYAVEYQLLKVQVDDDGNVVSQEKIEPTDDKRIVVEAGTVYAVKFKNSAESKGPLHFTALEVTPNMGIQVVAPYQESEIKLNPGESYLCDAFEADTAGELYEILLATQEPHDFAFVEQNVLPQVRGSSDMGDLQAELAEALFPDAQGTRGSRLQKQKKAKPVWLTRVIQWEVTPSKIRGRAGPPRSGPPGSSPGGASPPISTPPPEKSLTTRSTDDGYELVKVFYGTDREALVAGTDEAKSKLPLVPIFFGICLGIGGILVLKKTSALRIGFTLVALLATAITSFQHIVASQNQQIAQERTGVQYGPGRGEFEVGTCEISIPKDHRVGVVESPSIFSLEFREDASKHVIVDSITRSSFDDFYAELGDVVGRSNRNEAMVFVHGYNVSFESAARRTGQMAYDLKYAGAPIFFSWPSQATEVGYTIDENNVTWAVPHLKQFLEDIRKKTGVKSLNIIAHSMGNRAVTNVLKELHLEYQNEGQLFNQVILAAPDVDAGVFKNDIAPKITQIAEQVTLYASSKDRALIASRNVHGYPRAGESGDGLVIVDDLDTIDVTEIDTSLLGHSYYGDSDSIVADIYQVLHKGNPPGDRPGLRESFSNQLKYWIFNGE